MIQGWCLSPARIHVQGACGSWIILPCVPAARPLRVTGDRLRRQDDEPVRHAPAYRGASAIAAWKTLSAACEDVSLAIAKDALSRLRKRSWSNVKVNV